MKRLASLAIVAPLLLATILLRPACREGLYAGPPEESSQAPVPSLRDPRHSTGPLRIAVFTLFHPRELVLRPVRGGIVRVNTGAERVSLEGARLLRLRAEGGKVRWNRRDRLQSGIADQVSTRDAAGEFLLTVPGKIQRRFRGQLLVQSRDGVLLALVLVDRETAVAAAVAAESPPTASIEALMAQAVATRSYYAAARPRHDSFDFCDTTHCQFLREPPRPGHPAAIAAARTRGLVLAWHGAPFAALFSSSCGGRTRTLAEAGMQAENYPYFAVECPACREHAATWETNLPASDAQLLQADPTERARLDVARRNGWSKLPGGRFTVSNDGNEAVVRGRGAGHGIGLCQLGASSMAASGSTFRQILAYYFPNASLVSLD